MCTTGPIYYQVFAMAPRDNGIIAAVGGVDVFSLVGAVAVRTLTRRHQLQSYQTPMYVLWSRVLLTLDSDLWEKKRGRLSSLFFHSILTVLV